MVMPGQEQMVFTKEILLFTVNKDAPINHFFLFWALRLKDVQKQWERVIFMQTNREDLGDRYRLIEIPYTKDPDAAKEVSKAYREYFEGLDELSKRFASLSNDL